MNSDSLDTASSPANEASGSKGAQQTRSDLVELTKARLSVLVVVTTGAGFISAWDRSLPFAWMLMIHTIFGTLLSAFGAAVFNQLLEVRQDARMKRTADRPLPAGRMPQELAFVIGWLLAGFGIVHLGVKVNPASAMLAGITLALYIFVYTPLKRRSSWNTIVGAVTGGIPPMIGWVAAGGGFDAGAFWWFALLFFWQLPHFFAINWIHREEYMNAGFIMLANKDDTGSRTSLCSLFFSFALVLLSATAPLAGVCRWWFLGPGLLTSGVLAWLSFQFLKARTVESARKLFFGTLIYLPVTLIALLLAKT